MATFTQRVPTGPDDGRSRSGGGGNYDNSGITVILGHNGGQPFDSWFRYTNVTIPQGAMINSVTLEFVANGATGINTVRLNIYCNDEDTAVAPTTALDHDGKSRTTDFTAWDGEGAWADNDVKTSDDFTSAVQEVVDRGGWSFGNALMVLIDDDGSDIGAQRVPDSQDLGGGTEAEITIEWESGFIPRTGGIF